MFPEWTVVVGLYIGAAIGSFLNVVIYRMPRGLALGEPRHSFCPNCKARLTALDLVPVLSWLVLRGRCRHCRIPISPRYLIVELITGATWAGFWWQHLVVGSDPWRAICLCLFGSALIAATLIDLRHYIIPDQINAFILAVGAAYNAGLYVLGSPLASWHGVPSALAGALIGWGALWMVALLGRAFFGKDAMGHGDIKMARGIGAVLFPVASLVSFGLAIVLGAVLGMLQIILRRGAREPEDEAQEEEFEPPESLGSLVRCGLGYLLCIDVIGLFHTKLYEKWFGENPYAVEAVEEEELEVGATMIPFGPYLALGALTTALFERQLLSLVEGYWTWATGGTAIFLGTMSTRA